MKYTLEITEEASIEIEDAFDWYEAQQTDLGTLFLEQLDVTFDAILNVPNGFSKVSENKRQAPVTKYPFVIIYELFGSNIVILAVFHTSRHPEKKR